MLRKLAIFAFCIVGFLRIAQAEIDPKAARDLYDKVTPSLLVVQYTYDGELGRRELSGTGVVVSEDGLVMVSIALTPTIIPDAQMKDFKLIIPGTDEQEVPAEFQGRDERGGVSFVKAKEPRKWSPIKFEDHAPAVGEEVLSVGMLPKQLGYKAYLARSTVAAQIRGAVPLIMVGGEGLGTVGAPVFDAQGRAIGMVNALRGQTPFLDSPREEQNFLDSPPRLFVTAGDFLISLATPPTPEKPVQIPHLGVAQLTSLTKDVAEYYGLKSRSAVQVGDVIPGYPADQAGLKRADVIVKLNGEPLEPADDPEETPLILTRKLMRMHVGQTITFSILRQKDQPLTEITVKLGERPMQANKAKRFFAEDLGFSTREMVFDDTYLRKLPPQTKGVAVVLIKPNSSAATGKLQGGDLITKLNQTPIESLEQFRTQYEQVRKDRPTEAVVFEVLRGANTQIVRIEPPQ